MQAGEHMQSFYNGMAIVGSLVITALVIVLTYLASRWYAGKMKHSVAGRHLKVVDRVALGSGCALIVVQAGDKFYLLGQGDKNIRLICELDAFTPELYETLGNQTSFQQLFEVFMKKTKGKDASNDSGGE